MKTNRLCAILLMLSLLFAMTLPQAAAETADPASATTDNVVTFYQENKEICDAAYNYYKGYEENMDRYVRAPVSVTTDVFLSHINSETILAMTANPIERGVFLRFLSELNQNEPLDTYRINDVTVNICNLENGKTIIHINPGKTGEEYTRRAINRFTQIMYPDYICLVGICYGMNMEKHTIGSVFISEGLKTFRLNFRDNLENDDIRFEVEEEYSERPSASLIQRIQDRIMYSRFYNILVVGDTMTPARAEAGMFLSCNSLMSSRKVKEAIINQYYLKGSMPLGGEMEGAGILKSNIVESSRFDKWLVIKSVCDWGEKKNALDPDPAVSERIKDSLQAYAMTNTCGVFIALLEDFV